MKDFLMFMRRAVLAGAAALAFFSCARVREAEPEPEAPALCRTIRFHATELTTKAQFGTPDNGVYPTLWTSNDTEAKISLNYGSAMAAEVTPSSDGKSSTLSAVVDFEGVNGPYTFYAVSPSSAALSLSPSRSSWKVSIPCEQTPTAGSVDENAIILAASSLPYGTSAQIADVDLYFSHLTAYGRVTLTNLDLIPSGASIQAVELTATTPIVGDWFWACEASNEGVHTLLDYGASYTVTLHTSNPENVWFACAPVDLSGELMVVRVITNQGVLERTIEFDGNDFRLQAGATAVFSVNMNTADAEFTANGSGSGGGSGNFTLVTDVSTLAAGDEVLIVYTAGGKAMGTSAGNYRSPVDISISNGSISSTGEAVVFTLCYNADGTWAFKDPDNYYLASQSSGNNYLVNVNSVNDYASWDIEIDGSGLAILEAQDGSRKYMLYNNSSPRFTCYDSPDKSGMSKVSLYRRSGGGSGTSAEDPMLSKTEYGCYLGTGLEWQFAAGTEQMTRSYDAGGVLTFSLIDPSDIEELEIRGYTKSKLKGDSVTVTVNWRKGLSTVHSGSYNMRVIKEQGPKVWLGDGSGKGFIIKK